MVAADDGIELTQNGNRTAVSLAGKTRLHASDAPARFIVQAERIKGGTNFGRSFLLFKTEFRLGKNGMTETDDVGVAATNDSLFILEKTLQMKRLRWSSKKI